MARNPYSNIIFEKQVNWLKVDPHLLQTINRIARAKGQIVDVFSGYRDNAYSKAHGGFAGDPHTQGVAVDAYINGKPIGEVWSAKDFKAAGLRSGNVPNFYKGEPDPEHVDLLVDGSNGGSDASTGSGDSGTGGGVPYTAPVTADELIQQDLSSAPPPPTAPVVGANVMGLPGTAMNEYRQQPQYETWKALAALPGASTDTMRLAQLASYGADQTGSG